MFGKKEQSFEFRKRLTAKQKLKPDGSITPASNELSLAGGIEFIGNFGTVLEYAKKDFRYFLSDKNENGAVKIRFIKDDAALGEYAEYKGRIVTVTSDGIVVNAFDDRGAAMALYDLEKKLLRKKAPILECGVFKDKPLFSPRMIHSAYGLEEYPKDYLIKLVKEGVDSIVIFTKDINTTQVGELDFNALIKTANEIGLDVYAYCMLKSFYHPLDENAEEIYDGIYKRFFDAHPGFKGLVLVGESVEFPSRDPAVCPRHYYEVPESGIPDGRVSPGWWPCKDYPEWVSLVAKSARKANPDCDIVFWTYNWGYAPEADRIALINALPENITLQVTFEMFEKRPLFDINQIVMDYSISFPGPGKYYLSEAEAAKKRGIKLYSMTNTGGRTWDFGILPYIPSLYLWRDRFEAVRKSHFEHGLSGLMECHHYGFTPSFISRFGEYVFNQSGDDVDKALDTALCDFFGDNSEGVKYALSVFSEAMRTYYFASDEMQYGPMRIATAYPFILTKKLLPPQKDNVSFGLGICFIPFKTWDFGRYMPQSLRLSTENKCLKALKAETLKAVKILSAIPNKCDETRRLLNMMKFIACTFETAKNSFEFYKWKMRLMSAETRKDLNLAIANIKKIGEREILNAKKSIQYVERDSGIGFEPSMGYACNKERIEWKIQHTRYMLDVELAVYEKA